MTFSTSRALLLCAMLLCVSPLMALQEEDSKEKILADQKRLTEQYELLEKKLFSLYQYEQDQNPERAELLQKAFQQSKEKLTLQKFNSAVQQLSSSRFRNAEKSQGEINVELQELLDLLQSEDRNKRVRDQIDQYKEYIKEINRILRIQQGIRGQAERGDQSQELKDDQKQNAVRTDDLGKEIKQNDASDQDPSENNSEGEQGEQQPGDQGEQQPGEQQPGEQQPGEQQPGEQQPGEQQGEQKPGVQGQQGEQQQESNENPVQKKLQQAEQKMREAKEKMDEAKRDESVEKMREAERELEQARQELERILRQLREEEIKRMLATLESRFRRMMELQLKIREDTIALDGTRESAAKDEFEIQAGKLAIREKGLVTEAARALLVLEDEGSSIAVTESLLQVQQDMQQVADRLTTAKTDETTQEIQLGIIETLGFLLEVFEQAQTEQQESKFGEGQQGQGPPGDEALINKLAELKLIRGLQNQILTRHTRYSRLLENPTDEVGHSDDPGIQQALEQLSVRQQKLHQITHDIVVGKNR